MEQFGQQKVPTWDSKMEPNWIPTQCETRYYDKVLRQGIQTKLYFNTVPTQGRITMY